MKVITIGKRVFVADPTAELADFSPADFARISEKRCVNIEIIDAPHFQQSGGRLVGATVLDVASLTNKSGSWEFDREDAGLPMCRFLLLFDDDHMVVVEPINEREKAVVLKEGLQAFDGLFGEGRARFKIELYEQTPLHTRLLQAGVCDGETIFISDMGISPPRPKRGIYPAYAAQQREAGVNVRKYNLSFRGIGGVAASPHLETEILKRIAKAQGKQIEVY